MFNDTGQKEGSRHKAGEAFVSKPCESWKEYENQNCNDDLEKMTMGYGLDLNK